MPSAQSRMRRDAAENLDRCLAAAVDLFAARGLEVPQSCIAERAGVSVATLYRRFPNKDGVIAAVYRPRVEEAVEIAAQAAGHEDAWEGLVWFLQQSSDAMAHDRGFREFVLGGFGESLGWSRSAPGGEMVQMLQQMDARVGPHLRGLLERAKAAGDLREDFGLTDVQVIAAAVQATVTFGGADHPDLYRRTLHLFLDALRPARSAPSALPARALTEEELDRLTARATTDAEVPDSGESSAR